MRPKERPRTNPPTPAPTINMSAGLRTEATLSETLMGGQGEWGTLPPLSFILFL